MQDQQPSADEVALNYSAMADLVTFWQTMRESTPLGRKLEMPKFPAIRQKIVAAASGGTYVLERLTKFEIACRELMRSGGNEETLLSDAWGDVVQIGNELKHHGRLLHWP